jgi:glycerophosphoryl diester phosphodiesterase
MGDDQVLGSDAPSPRPLPMLLAHRGDHRHYPENTLAAFRAALAVRRLYGGETMNAGGGR